MSEWKETTLGDIINFRRGHDLPKTEMKEGKIPVVGSNGIIGFHDISTTKAPCVSIGRSGNVGTPLIINQDCWAHNTTLYIDDFKGNDPYYIFYHLGTLNLKDYGGGSAVPTLNRNHIHPIPTKIPPLPEQKAIAHILGSLDDKIELNRQMNQTLEAMAQALFKSWFVDFDPVIDNALAQGNPIPEELQARAEKRKGLPDSKKLLSTNPSLAAQFPAAFVFNETLGKWIPEGWEVKSFGEVSKCFDSKRIPLSKKEREEMQPGSFPYYGATSINEYINDYIFDDTFLLLGEDGSVVKEDGTPFTQYVWGKIWVNNHAHVLQGRNGISTEHLLTFIRNEKIGAYVTGAVQMKLNQGNMNRIPFLFSNTLLNEEFSKVLDKVYSKFKVNHEEIQTLKQLRDRLLPELISGRVRVKED